MQISRRTKYLILSIAFLLFFNGFLLYFGPQTPKNELTLAMFDVGQGEAVFVESPTGKQVLFDAGPTNGHILNQLSKVMSPFDRSIDVLVITNPDADHIAGFLDVLKKYKVGQVIEPGTFNDSQTYSKLKQEIQKQNIGIILARSGMNIDLGGGANIEILFPDQDVSEWRVNDGSIIARLFYQNTSVMLTGDATTISEKFMLFANKGKDLQSDVLKVGHHGSRSSTSYEFIKAVMPKYAIISDGKNNKYGHPHPETLDALTKFGIKIFRTDLDGTIIMKSDGQTETFSFIK